MTQELYAPFSYFGSKRLWAPLIWKHLGNTDVYIEPFAGSLAVLLLRPWGPAQKEIACDTDGLVCNAWRAIQWNPEETAYWAEWPTIHQDLTARHRWLQEWRDAGGSSQVEADPEFFDPKVAGWWIWGASNWIGRGWCQTQSAQIPHSSGSGTGISNQKVTRPSILNWFKTLEHRLKRVVILNRSWETVLSSAVLGYPNQTKAIFFDPPYLSKEKTIYAKDSPEAATASAKWAIKNGDQYRIAFAFEESTFSFPSDWIIEQRNFLGYRRQAPRASRKSSQDIVAFSPLCRERLATPRSLLDLL